MRIRTGVSAAAIAAALLFSAGAARAEGPVAPAPVSIFGVDRVFGAPAVLGDSWSRAVHAALGEMARLLDQDRAALRQAVVPPVLPRRRTLAWQTPSTSVHDLEPVRALIELRPVLIEPPTQATRDVRGERAALLGAHLELPWSVP
jgi:hypothetical protein